MPNVGLLPTFMIGGNVTFQLEVSENKDFYPIQVHRFLKIKKPLKRWKTSI